MKPVRLITIYVGHKLHTMHKNYLYFLNAYFQGPTIEILILSFHAKAWNIYYLKMSNELDKFLKLKNGTFPCD